MGEQVLSGGRYDTLLGQFGENQGSIGFGINVDLASQMVKTEPEKVRKSWFLPKIYRQYQIVYIIEKLWRHRGKQLKTACLIRWRKHFPMPEKKGFSKVHLVGEEIMEYELGKGTDADEDN